MNRKGQRTANLDHDPKLLIQFSSQRFGERLSLFDLASGKLPEPGHMVPFGTPGQKNSAFTI